MRKQQGTGGTAAPGGVVRREVRRELGYLRIAPLGWRTWNFLRHRSRGLPADVAARFVGRTFGVVTQRSALHIVKYSPSPDLLRVDRWQQLQQLMRQHVDVRTLAAAFGGHVVDYGLVSTRVVTDAGVGYLVDAWQNLVEMEAMKFHALGTGTNAEAAGNTGLQTEWTSSEYSTRATGSLTEGASGNIFRTVGTNTKANAGTSAVTEHMILTSATIGAGTGWDRSVFSAVNLAQNDSLQTTYDATFTSGG